MKCSVYVPLAFCLAGALAFVFCRRADGPAADALPSDVGALAEGFPEAVGLRVLAKRLIAREVAEGRRPLAEAAALFAALNRLPPGTPASVPLSAPPPAGLPGDTEAGRLCQQVAAFLGVALEDRPPGEVAAAVARLEREFREAVYRRGEMRLPDPSSLPPVRDLLDRVRRGMTASERQALFSARQRARGVE